MGGKSLDFACAVFARGAGYSLIRLGTTCGRPMLTPSLPPFSSGEQGPLGGQPGPAVYRP